MNPLVKDLGEFGLIEQLRRYQRARPGLVAGIGDDAADAGPAGLVHVVHH